MHALGTTLDSSSQKQPRSSAWSPLPLLIAVGGVAVIIALLSAVLLEPLPVPDEKTTEVKVVYLTRELVRPEPPPELEEAEGIEVRDTPQPTQSNLEVPPEVEPSERVDEVASKPLRTETSSPTEVRPEPSLPARGDTPPTRPTDRSDEKKPRGEGGTTASARSDKTILEPERQAKSSGSLETAGAAAGADETSGVSGAVPDVVPVAKEPTPMPTTKPVTVVKKGVNRPPRLIRNVQPPYPPIARSQRLTGKVTVRITVAEDGTVEKVSVEHSSSPLFNRSALAAAKKMVFEPALVNGNPARQDITQVFDFKIK